MTELLRTLAALLEPPSPELAPLARLLELGDLPSAAEHADLFLFQLYPYASVYLGAEGMLGGEARDRIAGFFRALGLTPPDPADDLPVMLSFQAALGEREDEAVDPEERAKAAQARRAFFHEHLASWLFLYLDKLADVAPPFYRRWGQLLGEALAEELLRLGPPERLPLHLSLAPPAADPRTEGAAAFLASLLSPVRSGVLLVRDDLRRAARELGVGSRAGERRFALEALLSQDGPEVLAWLGREAEGWARRHGGRAGALGATAGFWTARAEATARLCAELAAESREMQVR